MCGAHVMSTLFYAMMLRVPCVAEDGRCFFSQTVEKGVKPIARRAPLILCIVRWRWINYK